MLLGKVIICNLIRLEYRKDSHGNDIYWYRIVPKILTLSTHPCEYHEARLRFHVKTIRKEISYSNMAQWCVMIAHQPDFTNNLTKYLRIDELFSFSFYFTEMCFGPSKRKSGFKIGMLLCFTSGLSIGPIFFGEVSQLVQ